MQTNTDRWQLVDTDYSQATVQELHQRAALLTEEELTKFYGPSVDENDQQIMVIKTGQAILEEDAPIYQN